MLLVSHYTMFCVGVVEGRLYRRFRDVVGLWWRKALVLDG